MSILILVFFILNFTFIEDKLQFRVVIHMINIILPLISICKEILNTNFCSNSRLSIFIHIFHQFCVIPTNNIYICNLSFC